MKIVYYPDPVLGRRAAEVEVITDEVLLRSQEMFKLMNEAKGVGLAAPQVGWSVRLFVMNTTGEPQDERVYVNPELVEVEGEEIAEEGCLSFPDIRAPIVRATRVRMVATDLTGQDVEIAAVGFEARALQHEIDHLDGVLFTSRMNPTDRVRHAGRIKALEREARRARMQPSR